MNTARVDATSPTIRYALEYGAHTDKTSVCTIWDPTFMKVVDRYNNVWGGGYSCCIMILTKHMAKDAKARGKACAALKRIRA